MTSLLNFYDLFFNFGLWESIFFLSLDSKTYAKFFPFIFSFFSFHKEKFFFGKWANLLIQFTLHFRFFESHPLPPFTCRKNSKSLHRFVRVIFSIKRFVYSNPEWFFIKIKIFHNSEINLILFSLSIPFATFLQII